MTSPAPRFRVTAEDGTALLGLAEARTLAEAETAASELRAQYPGAVVLTAPLDLNDTTGDQA